MRYTIRMASVALVFVVAGAHSFADEPGAANDTIRVLSWNISDDAYISAQQEFQSLLRWADADILLLDEIAPSSSKANLMKSLDTLRADKNETWNVNIGVSGGRQRCAIASRAPQESVPEFSSLVPYPESARRYLLEHMSNEELDYANYGFEGGIPVNAAIILTGGRRLLTVIADLQCCGDDQISWHEYRRRAEAREIRRLIRQVLQRTSVDGIIIAGDFNLVNGTMPMVVLSGPYSEKNAGLIAAEVYHPDKATSWTWDGRGTPFPSGTLDYQLYGPMALRMRSGFILETESLPPETLKHHGLESDMLKKTGRHRPLLVEYQWN